jgi:DNA transformation protein and related proteins
MTTKSDRFYVQLGASQARRRLKGHGFGVKKVETVGKNRAVIIHTATDRHLRQLQSLFYDAIEVQSEKNDN